MKHKVLLTENNEDIKNVHITPQACKHFDHARLLFNDSMKQVGIKVYNVS